MFVFLKDISHYIIDKLAITAYIFLWQTVTQCLYDTSSSPRFSGHFGVYVLHRFKIIGTHSIVQNIICSSMRIMRPFE